MRNDDNNSMGFILSKFLSHHKLDEGYLANQSIDAWQQVLGVKIKNYIDELFVKNKILFVRINSPIMKKELEYRKTQTLQEIHQKVQNSFIVEINYI